MSDSTQKAAPLPTKLSSGRRTAVYPAANGLFLAALVLMALKIWFHVHGPAMTAWPEVALVLTATAATMWSLSRQLPWQNVLLASVIIGAFGGALSALNAITAIPFGPCVYLDAAGPKLFDVLPWPIPLVWIVTILNCRGVGRLILRPWRKTRSYGFRLMGLTALLSLALELGLEPFGANAGHYWFWKPTRLPVDWFHAPLTNFAVWPATVLLILAFATPALIRKKPGSSPPDYHPLLMWLGLNVLFTGAALSHQLWSAAALTVVTSVIVTISAIRGANW